MSYPIKIEHILNRIWLVFCLIMLVYQFNHIPKFLRNTSYEASSKITSTATKIHDKMYLEKYGMTADKYRWHKRRQAIEKCINEYLERNKFPPSAKNNSYAQLMEGIELNNLRQRGGMFCENANLKTLDDGIIFSREELMKLSVQINFTTWMKNIFFSLTKNILIFFAFCIGSFFIVRIFPVWIMRGNGLVFTQDFETFPMNMIKKKFERFFPHKN